PAVPTAVPAAAAAVTAPAAAAAAFAARAAAAIGFRHLRARRQPELPFRDDVLAGVQPLGDDHFLTLLAHDRHRAHFRGAIRPDDVDVLTGSRRLHGARRHDDRVLVS